MLDSIAAQNSTGGGIIQVLFLVLLVCHIPYIFIFCKQGAINFVTEYMENSVSYAIERKFKGLSTKQEHHQTRETVIALMLYSICIFVACMT